MLWDSSIVWGHKVVTNFTWSLRKTEVCFYPTFFFHCVRGNNWNEEAVHGNVEVKLKFGDEFSV